MHLKEGQVPIIIGVNVKVEVVFFIYVLPWAILRHCAAH